jgi:hypothetical protein
LPIVQGGATKQVSVANLTAGRAVSATQMTLTTGNLIVASGQGIDFSATSSGSGTMTSELLADYEEGTWTPTIVGVTTAGEGTYNAQAGTYTKIGNRVFLNAIVSWTAHTGTGSANIGGLPFARVDVNLSLQLVPGNYTYTAGRTLIAYAGPGGISTTQLGVYEVDSGILPTAVDIDSSAFLVLSGFYYTT